MSSVERSDVYLVNEKVVNLNPSIGFMKLEKSPIHYWITLVSIKQMEPQQKYRLVTISDIKLLRGWGVNHPDE